MIPIWKKKKSEISKDDYNEFYKSKFYDMSDPLKVIHTKVEGVISYDALSVSYTHLTLPTTPYV
mgnify:CR=1 FL=1